MATPTTSVTATVMTSLTTSLLLMVTSSRAYPDGAPRKVCRSMFPHHGANPQTSRPVPYTITVSSNVYSPGSRNTSPIRVTLRGLGRTQFKGLIVEARSLRDCNDTVGTFKLDSPPSGESHRLQLLTCQRPDDYVTHVDSKDKTAVTFLWIPPDTGKGHIYIRATVAQTASTFWNTVQSPIVYQGSSDATSAINCRVPSTLETALTLDAASGPRNEGSFNSYHYFHLAVAVLFSLAL